MELPPDELKVRPDMALAAGGGEMGELIQSKDWSNTPLGPMEDWSQSLRMMVSFLLTHRFPLLLWWGPDYIQLYNDPYRSMLGTKHPISMGQPAHECWAEIWDVIGPLIDTPFKGGPATWMEDIVLEIDRHGFIEECHFTIAYSPVPDETAPQGIGGVLATVHEITEKVIGERRGLILRDLSACVTEAKTAEETCTVAAKTLAKYPQDLPFALLYLMAPDGERAYLTGMSEVSRGEPDSPLVVTLACEDRRASIWPLARAMRAETFQVVEDLTAGFDAVPPGPWSDHPHTAVVVPIPSNKAHQTAGWLVAGVSPRLQLDEPYRRFFGLAASQIATAIANARAYEEERQCADGQGSRTYEGNGIGLSLVQEQAALRKSEALYRKVVEFLPVAVYTCEAPSGVITFYNDHAAELWGRAPKIGDTTERFCGSFKTRRSDGTLLSRDQTPMALAVKKGNKFRNQEVIIERPDGTRITALVTIDPIRDESGQVAGAINAFIDITTRRQAEQLRVEQKRLLEMIALGAPLYNCLASLCAAVPKLNPHARANILLTDDQGQTFPRSIAPDLLPSFGQRLKDAPINDLAIGTCGEAVFRTRPATCRDIMNDDRWSQEWRDLCIANNIFACHSAPILGVDGSPLGSLMLCFDEPRAPTEWEQRLTEFGTHMASIALERDRSSQALRESERRLRTLSETLERQVEARTAELQRQAARLRRLAGKLTSAEQRERKHLAAILHDGLQQLLVAAKIRLNVARSQIHEPVALTVLEGVADLLGQAVDSSRNLTRELRPPVLYESGLFPALRWLASELPKLHDLDVAIDTDEDTEPALSDDVRALLFEAVRELLFNVAKHAGVKEATVRVRRDGQRLRIAVEDKGSGFDVKAAAREEDPQQPGMGLFSIHERLAALNGDIAIKSIQGEGTRIELTVLLAPAVDEQASDQAERLNVVAAHPAMVSPLAAAHQARVLVVDDHAIVREGIANVLSGDERLMVVGEAADGVEAIEAVERHQPDVVLIDVNMPRMNGVEATREIRRRWPEVRIVALSVQDDAATARTMLRAGAAAFISKSDEAGHMIDAVLPDHAKLS